MQMYDNLKQENCFPIVTWLYSLRKSQSHSFVTDFPNTVYNEWNLIANNLIWKWYLTEKIIQLMLRLNSYTDLFRRSAFSIHMHHSVWARKQTITWNVRCLLSTVQRVSSVDLNVNTANRYIHYLSTHSSLIKLGHILNLFDTVCLH